MALTWLQESAEQDIYDEGGACIVKCSECKRLLDHADVADNGSCHWTSKGKTRFYFLEGRGQYRSLACGWAKQEANNEKLARDRPAPNVGKCMICDVDLVHPGRKTHGLTINCSRAQWRKGHGDRRCHECAAEHEKWHDARKFANFLGNDDALDAACGDHPPARAGADPEAEASASSGRG